MSLFNCDCKRNCVLWAVIASVIVGIVTAFLQITGIITVTAAFLWVILGVAVVYLGVVLLAAALSDTSCPNSIINALLAGILGTVLFSVILLAVGIVATSPVSAILAGLALLFLSLTLTSTACYVKCLNNNE